ncbi:hypothetical protein IC757_07515 [Wenzhouxiangella sp. AB-CW3]|uniref:hypothetical protein n=1 Tax=Wenzhouxiangella sp. AB-CW3 TaxID=2771012 RepID=UPI00168B2E75|nr:hypothetical protein [Wenzhouxiangella sp. AB-CW3]QOC23945.1 hypothetical protein IC757_07515 [Wenzhouxiangella sp. AB-CW3]
MTSDNPAQLQPQSLAQRSDASEQPLEEQVRSGSSLACCSWWGQLPSVFVSWLLS